MFYNQQIFYLAYYYNLKSYLVINKSMFFSTPTAFLYSESNINISLINSRGNDYVYK